MFFKKQKEIIEEQGLKLTEQALKIVSLEEQLRLAKKQKRVLESIDYNMDDPSPLDQAERSEYVARVAGFHRDIMEKKIFHLIVEQYKQLSNPLNAEKFDVFHKANINALSLLLDWGDEMVREHVENINSQIEKDNANQN